MIPLWPVNDKTGVKRLLKEYCPLWARVCIEGKGKYLGYIIGPQAEHESWKKPLAKFEKRVLYWASSKLGLAMNVVVFNTYIAPVLEYVGQLEEPTAEVRAMVSWSLRRLASGPGNWVTQADLENLCEFGFKQEFRTIEHTARAAKLR
eukprot:4710863-Karenia_brevis.AAC.1